MKIRVDKFSASRFATGLRMEFWTALALRWWWPLDWIRFIWKRVVMRHNTKVASNIRVVIPAVVFHGFGPEDKRVTLYQIEQYGTWESPKWVNERWPYKPKEFYVVESVEPTDDGHTSEVTLSEPSESFDSAPTVGESES